MAQYDQLPVYKAGYDLLLLVFQLTHNLSREYKHTLGEKLNNQVTDMLTNIYRANRVFEKVGYIEKARENLELVRLYIRILKDVGQINSSKHITLNQPIEMVSKQLSGWQKSSNKTNT